MLLRPYQNEAIDASFTALRSGDPVIQMATGTGKSAVITNVAARLELKQCYTLILTHSQQLVKQNAETYQRITSVSPGLVCAGLGRADLNEYTTFGTVQSIINPLTKGKFPKPDLIVIDEAHRVAHNEGTNTLYEKVFNACPNAKRLGLSATPWRMDNGLIYGSDPNYFWFDQLAYKYTAKQGIEEGYLCPLVAVETEVQLDVEEPSSGDFVSQEVEEAQTNKWLTAVAKSIAHLARKRNCIAVYCPTVLAANKAAAAIAKETGWTVEIITGDSSSIFRQIAFDRMSSGSLRVICSVDTITTGFDMPCLDCLVCLRPTTASNLWVQMLGRLTRLHPSKVNGLVLDYVGNLRRLGGVETLDTYVRERNLEVSEEVIAVPNPRKDKRVVYPGLTSLRPIDPVTGEEAGADSLVPTVVHNVSFVVIKTRRNPDKPVIMATYICMTEEGAKINATSFIDTEEPNEQTVNFFKQRNLAVKLPAPANKLTWQLKGAVKPIKAVIRKSGRYWTVINEIFSTQ